MEDTIDEIQLVNKVSSATGLELEQTEKLDNQDNLEENVVHMPTANIETNNSHTVPVIQEFNHTASCGVVSDPESSNDDDTFLTRKRSLHKHKRLRGIDSSDDESIDNTDKQFIRKEQNNISNDENDEVVPEVQKRSKISQVIDSDSSDEENEDVGVFNSASNSPEKKSQQKVKGLSDIIDEESSDEESIAPLLNHSSPPPMREKGPMRLSAKQAQENMKLIQSESQRMDREASISIPYHRPKQRSLKEFLNRKSIIRPAEPLALQMNKPAASIKMSKEELEIYAKQLEERAKEAEEFFKSDSEESEMEDSLETNILNKPPEQSITFDISNNLEKTEELPVQESKSNPESNTLIIEIDKENVENISAEETVDDKKNEINGSLEEEIIEKLVEREISSETTNTENVLDCTLQDDAAVLQTAEKECEDIITKKPILDFSPLSDSEEEIIETGKSKEVTLTQMSDIKPKLSGGPDMIIDFDEDRVVTHGVSSLMQRFIKHSVATKKTKDRVKMSVVTAEAGIIQTDILTINIEDEEKLKNIKPGAALMRLRQDLEAKMAQRRSEEFTKRLQEKKELESIIAGEDGDYIIDDEEEEAEMSDSGSSSDEELENEEETVEKDNNLMDLEAGEDNDDMDDEDEEENATDEVENNTDEEDDTEDDEDKIENTTKRKSRIIAMNESESENEMDTKLSHTPYKQSTRYSVDMFQSQEDNDLIPAFQNRDGTPKSLATSSSDNGFLSPVLRLTALQGIETSKLYLDKSISPVCPTTQQTTHQEKVDSLQKRLFSESEQSDPPNTQELMNLCTGNFVTQADTELLNLCSGTFDSQEKENASQEITSVALNTEPVNNGKTTFLSSDEDDTENQGVRKKKKKFTKKKHLQFSDDESGDDEDHREELRENDLEQDADNLNYVDYDSEENEIDIRTINKKSRNKEIGAFFENEAELSESDWGSADEDEKGLDRLEVELGDEDQFDSKKVRQELERIHMRQILDEDKREVRLLQELLLEDGEEHADANRDRKFRWKNINGNWDEQSEVNVDDKNHGNSDEEDELQWRKLRHEKEIILREKLEKENHSVGASDLIVSEELALQGSAAKKNIILLKNKTTRPTDTADSAGSSFLIAKNKSILKSTRGSFLRRDTNTLARLAELTKHSSEDGTTGPQLGPGSKGNFVFTSLQPTSNEENMEENNRKRKTLDRDITNIAKKPKTDESRRPTKRLLLDHLG